MRGVWAGFLIANVTTDSSDRRMEISSQGDHESDVVEASTESTLQRSCHLRRHRNFLASPLLRLPTELVLKIFAHATEPDDGDASDSDSPSSSNDGPVLLVLTATCHQLREIGTTCPGLWSTVDLTIPPLAELFLERCDYDPHILIKSLSASEKRRSMYLVANPRREAAWERLEGRALNNLHSIAFRGLRDEFTHRIIGVLRRAPNVSNLDLCNHWIPSDPRVDLPRPPGDPIPNLSTLRLHNFLISWTSPHLQNLRQLTLETIPPSLFSGHVSIGPFLAALARCPHLEVLSLTHTGPDLPVSHQNGCDTVVQLRRLRKFYLNFHDPPRVGYILSHIGYPESTHLELVSLLSRDADPSDTISQILPHRRPGTIQHPRKPTHLTFCLHFDLTFYTDTLLIQFPIAGTTIRQVNPQAFTQFASKVVEVVGGDAIRSLTMRIRFSDLSDETWEAFVHGFPRLERIRYELLHYEFIWKEEDWNSTDPFLLVFSRPFEGGLVCPRLQHLELPWAVFAHGSSATVLKRALAERDACGRRLKWMGVTGDRTERNKLDLEPFRDLVDEIQ